MNLADAKRVLETALICTQQPMPVRDMRSLFAGALGADTLKTLLEELRDDWSGKGVELVSVASNAEGARRARDEAGTAAIAGDAAAEVYGLKLLVREIEDRPDNSTRFLVIGRKILSPSGRDRTTLLVSGSGTTGPGALLKLLEPFAANGISLSRLESRPSKRKKWDYVFFLDAEGHVDDPKLARALKAVKARGSLCKVLGSYPRAVL